MSKKTQRIAELERERADRIQLIKNVMRENSELKVELARLRAERRPSLRDAAKREWQQLTERLLASVGL